MQDTQGYIANFGSNPNYKKINIFIKHIGSQQNYVYITVVTCYQNSKYTYICGQQAKNFNITNTFSGL